MSSTSAEDGGDQASAATAADGPLLERSRELHAIDSVIEQAAVGRGGALLLEGQAGIGKTTLLDAATRRAGSKGVRVIRARGDQLEAGFSWGVAVQLLRPALSADTELLSGAAALTRRLFESAPEPEGASADLFPLLHGLYWLIANLADRHPVLLVVDDAQWSDTESLRALLYVAGRLGDLRASLLLASRLVVTDRETAELLAHLAGLPGVRASTVEPLSDESIRSLVDMDLADWPDDVREAVVDVVGGNPFLCHELIDAIRGEPDGEPWSAARVRRLRPEGIRRSLQLRLAQLGDDAMEIARAVAVLGAHAIPPLVARLGGLGTSQVAACVDKLVVAGLLRAGPPLTFVHPVIREVVYHDLGPARRRRLHAAAARCLHAADVSAEDIAAHLLVSDPLPERWVVSVLRAAAEAQITRRAPARAAELLRRALEHSPTATIRLACLIELASAEAAAGEPTTVERLTDALALVPPGVAGAGVALDLAEALYASGRFPDAAETFQRGLDLYDEAEPAEEDDPVLEARLVAGLASVEVLLPQRSERVSRWAQRLVQSPPDEPSLADRVLLALAAGRYALGTELPCEHVADLAGRAVGHDGLPDALGRVVIEPVSFALLACDRFSQALAVLDAVIGGARARGDAAGYASLLAIRGACAFGQGRVLEAAADATDAVRLIGASATASRQALALAHHLLTVASLARGDLGEAIRAVDVPNAAELWAPTPMYGWYLDALARVQLAQAEPERALASFQAAGDRFMSAGGTGVFCPWRSGAAMAARAAGDLAAARSLAVAEERLARAFGAPRALAVALRCRAQMSAERDESVQLLREAFEVVAHSEAELERAHVLVALGATLRRAGRRREAREMLREGMDAARRCRARSLVDEAVAELEASGARRPRLPLTGMDALTPSELRVARLAADGLSNPEIAQALFVTRKTVEVHLSSVYRKLGIASREELRGALGT